jgi:hypothetical protein
MKIKKLKYHVNEKQTIKFEMFSLNVTFRSLRDLFSTRICLTSNKTTNMNFYMIYSRCQRFSLVNLYFKKSCLKIQEIFT